MTEWATLRIVKVQLHVLRELELESSRAHKYDRRNLYARKGK